MRGTYPINNQCENVKAPPPHCNLGHFWRQLKPQSHRCSQQRLRSACMGGTGLFHSPPLLPSNFKHANEWHVIAVLICTSPVTDNTEHLFVFLLLFISIPFLVKYVLKFWDHFLLVWFFYCWILKTSLHFMDKVLHDMQTFSLSLWFIFSCSWQCFQGAEILIFGETIWLISSSRCHAFGGVLKKSLPNQIKIFFYVFSVRFIILHFIFTSMINS